MSAFQNIQAEQAVLGAILLDPTQYEPILAAGVTSDVFTSEAHRRIFAAVTEMVDARKPIDPVAVAARLADQQPVVPAAYLHTCMQAVPTPGNAGYYARIIVNLWRRSRLYQLGARIAEVARTCDDVAEIAETTITYAARVLETVDTANTNVPSTAADVPAVLRNLEIPTPTILRRTDGVGLFYPERVNVVFGDPESGKTWIAYAAVAETLRDGKTAAIVDVDHNGAKEILNRLLLLGVPRETLADARKFVLLEPEDAEDLRSSIAWIRTHPLHVVVIDSIGEIGPMLGLSTNSPDEWTVANRQVLTASTLSGACVIAIDHLPKGEQSRQLGPIGTIAKRRAVNGVSLRATLRTFYRPGEGGETYLDIDKDRPGGLRAASPIGETQHAGIFQLKPVTPDYYRAIVDAPPKIAACPQDIAEADALQPKNWHELSKKTGWPIHKAQRVFAEWSANRNNRNDWEE